MSLLSLPCLLWRREGVKDVGKWRFWKEKKAWVTAQQLNNVKWHKGRISCKVLAAYSHCSVRFAGLLHQCPLEAWRNEAFQVPTQDLLNQNLLCNKILKWPLCTLKFWKHHSRTVKNIQGQRVCKDFSINGSVQFSSVSQLCPTLCDPMNRSMPSLPVHHQILEFSQTHVHLLSDAIQQSHTLSSPSLPAPNPSQHQGLFQWVNSSHEVAKVLEFQL